MLPDRDPIGFKSDHDLFFEHDLREGHGYERSSRNGAQRPSGHPNHPIFKTDLEAGLGKIPACRRPFSRNCHVL
jgi:hypothetical protein